MSHKKVKKSKVMRHFLKELQAIGKDILFLYRNFIHWNISKISISLWSFILGFIIAFPFILLTFVSGFLDPISWNEIIAYALTGNDVSLEIIGGLGEHPYWIICMVFLIFTSASFFLLSYHYGFFLLTRVSDKYVDGKKLSLRKNLYFSRPHIYTFLTTLCWVAVYVMTPIVIWSFMVGILFYLYHLQVLPFSFLSNVLGVLSFIGVLFLSYLLYRLIFSFIILAHDKRKASLSSARSYIKKSLKITHVQGYFKMLFIVVLFAVITSPFRSIDLYMQDEVGYMKDTLAYNSGLVANIDAEDMKYYEYITQEYSDMTNEEVVEKIVLYSRLRIGYFFLSYVLLSGLFTLILVSFYRRVLLKK